jgi:hypothetical protein
LPSFIPLGPSSIIEKVVRFTLRSNRMKENEWDEELSEMVHGDFVEGDKITGGDVGSSDSAIVIGRGAESTVQESLDRDLVNSMFESIYHYIEEIADLVVDRGYLNETVSKIQREALRGQEANANRLTDLLSRLATENEDVFQRVVDMLIDPSAGFAEQVYAAVSEAQADLEVGERGLQGGFAAVIAAVEASDLEEATKEQMETRLNQLHTQVDQGSEGDLGLFKTLLEETTIIIPSLQGPLWDWLSEIDNLHTPMKFVAEEILKQTRYT